MIITFKKEDNQIIHEEKTSSSTDSTWVPVSITTNSASDGEYTDVKDFDMLLENAVKQYDRVLRRLAEDD